MSIVLQAASQSASAKMWFVVVNKKGPEWLNSNLDGCRKSLTAEDHKQRLPF